MPGGDAAKTYFGLSKNRNGFRLSGVLSSKMEVRASGFSAIQRPEDRPKPLIITSVDQIHEVYPTPLEPSDCKYALNVYAPSGTFGGAFSFTFYFKISL